MNANVTKTPYYKERVEKIEKEILAITNNATYTVFSGDDAAYLLTLLNDRKGFLDAMYIVAPEASLDFKTSISLPYQREVWRDCLYRCGESAQNTT